MKPLKIVYSVWEYPPFPGNGGIGSYVWDTSHELVRRGHQVTVVAASADTRKEAEYCDDGIRVIRLPKGICCYGEMEFVCRNPWGYIVRRVRASARRTAYQRQVAVTLERLIDEGNADIVEFADYFTEGLLWLQTAHRRIPAVTRIHHPPSSAEIATLKSWIHRGEPEENTSHIVNMVREMRLADRVSVCSNAYLELHARLGSLCRDRMVLIPNGIRYDAWIRDSSARANQAPRPGTASIFFAGSISLHKGVVELAQAVEQLRAKGMVIELTMAGRQSMSIMRHFKRGSREGWIKLLGRVDRTELGYYYKTADICCFPSHRETFGLTALEALACGGLVVGSRPTPHSEFIQNGINGFLVDPGNADELARLIHQILGLSANQKRSLRAAARNMAHRYDVSIIVPEVLNFYRTVLNRNDGAM